jgi:hypothetical protein
MVFVIYNIVGPNFESQKLKISLETVAKIRGGSISSINSKLIATHIAIMTVNAAKDGSIHALAIIIACKLYP